MANPIKFSARIDQLQKLKAGSNPDLLENWTGLVFQAWAWDEVSQEALDRLVSHPYLPKTGLSQALWPSVVLRDIGAVRAGMAAGMDLKHIRPALNHGSVRASALFENATMAIHELLDAAGVPALTLKEVVRLIPASMRKNNHHAFEYLVARHWDMMELALTPPETSALVAQVLNQFHAATISPDSYRASQFGAWFAGHALQTFLSKGVDWTGAMHLVLDGSAQVKTIARLGLLVAQGNHARLDEALPPPVESAPRPRPRM